MSEPIHINPALTYENEAYTIGSRADDDKGNEYVFVKVTETCQQWRFVVYYPNNGFSARKTTASRCNIGDRVGVAQVNIPDDHYAWLMIYGTTLGRLAGSASDHDTLGTTGQAGQLRQTSGSQSRIDDVHATVDPSSTGHWPCILNWPLVVS